jgi:predicted transcriptional regulator
MDVIASVLRACGSGANKTRVMYASFLNHGQIGEYLRYLLEDGLIRYDSHSNVYIITKKGIQFLRIYDGISKWISPGKTVPQSPNLTSEI